MVLCPFRTFKEIVSSSTEDVIVKAISMKQIVAAFDVGARLDNDEQICRSLFPCSSYHSNNEVEMPLKAVSCRTKLNNVMNFNRWAELHARRQASFVLESSFLVHFVECLVQAIWFTIKNPNLFSSNQLSMSIFRYLP